MKNYEITHSISTLMHVGYRIRLEPTRRISEIITNELSLYDAYINIKYGVMSNYLTDEN